MGLREVRFQLTKICWRWLAGAVDSELRHGAADELKERADASFAAAPWDLGPANQCASAAEVARNVLGSNSNAFISNVLVLGRKNFAPPVKRTEIHLRHANEVPATLNLLTAALETSGIDFRTVPDPGMSMTEIWLTCPLNGGKAALLSCAVLAGVPAAEPVSAKTMSPRNQTQ